MRISLTLFCLITLNTNLLKAEENHFYYRKKIMPIQKYQDVSWLSDPCINCMAKKVLSSVTLPSQTKEFYVSTPGAYICNQLKDTKVLIFKSALGEQDFCFFKDRSFIDTGGLFYFAKKNSKKSN